MPPTGLDDPPDHESRRIASRGPARAARGLAVAAVLYVALAIALTWPLATKLTTHLPHDLGDPVLSSWILWWHAHVVPFTTTWWDGAGFFPAHGTVALSDHRVGLSLIGSPLIWMGGSAILAYNVALILSFALSALAMHALVLALTRRHDAAALAGVVFGFAPYRFDHVVHLEIVSSYWLPVTLLGLHLWIRTRERKWLVLFAASWLLQALTCGYYFFYLSVLLGLWIVWFLRSWRRDVWPVVLAGSLAVLPLVPVLLRYKSIHDFYGLRRGVREIELFSADVAGLMSGAPWLAGSSMSEALFKAEGQIYPGLVAVLLVLVAVVLTLRRADRPRGHRGRRILLGIALLAMAVAVSVPLFGAWRVQLGPLALSVSQAFKPSSVALLALVAYGATSPAFITAFRRRSTFAFYAAATICMWVLAFGPSPQLLGHRILYKAPYAWLMMLPGFENGLRVPARFAMLASLCLAVATGFAFTRLLARHSDRAASILAAVLLAVMTAEVWPGDFPLVEQPKPLAIPALPSRDLAVVELPLGGVSEDTVSIYHSVAHRLPVVNGYSGYDPPHYALLREAVRVKDPHALVAISRHASLLVAIHKHADGDNAWEQYARGLPGARFLERSNDVAFYLLAQQPTARTGASRSALPVRAIVATEARDDVAWLHDERMDTVWVTPRKQRGGEQIAIELAAARDVCGVGLAVGPMIGGLPRRLDIAVSADGHTWTPVWNGQTTGLGVEAALRDPATVDLRIDTNPQSAVRFVRLTQEGQDDKYEWAIAELTVLSCSS